MTVYVSPEFDNVSLRKFISELPEAFVNGGEVIYNGRNTVKKFNIGGCELIVKRFRFLSFFRAVLYLGRSSKALRAFQFGKEFLKRGIKTPAPVAAVEIRKYGLIRDSYFISLPIYASDLTYLRNYDFNRNEAKMLASFIYEVQNRGILHGDLNLTNILLLNADSPNPLTRYALIDTNRSNILRKCFSPSVKQRANNLMRLTHRRDLMRFIIDSVPATASEICLIKKLTFKSLLRMEARKRFLHRIFPH